MPGRIGCVHNKLISKHSADNLIRGKFPDFRRNRVKIYTGYARPPSLSSTASLANSGSNAACELA